MSGALANGMKLHARPPGRNQKKQKDRSNVDGGVQLGAAAGLLQRRDTDTVSMYIMVIRRLRTDLVLTWAVPTLYWAGQARDTVVGCSRGCQLAAARSHPAVETSRLRDDLKIPPHECMPARCCAISRIMSGGAS